MANKRIIDLDNYTAPANTDVLAIEDTTANETKKITRTDFLKGTPFPADTIDAQAIKNGAAESHKNKMTVGCRVYRSAAFNITGGGGAEHIPFDAEDFDTGSNFDIVGGYFIAPYDGYYFVSGQITVTDLSIDGSILAFIYVDGASVAFARNYGPVATADPSVSVSSLVYCTAGNAITLYGDASTTEPIATGTQATFMSIYLVGIA